MHTHCRTRAHHTPPAPLLQRVAQHALLAIASGLCLCCSPKESRPGKMFGQNKEEVTLYDLPQIQQAGTLIGITLNGPDTYYEYHGREMGTQFLLAEDFARHIGARLQMETAADTATLREKLARHEADFIALETGPEEKWLTRDDTPLLKEAIAQWWNPQRKQSLPRPRTEEQQVKRTMRPLMHDKARGVISAYDQLLADGARTLGWDWRLLAAQCYQESGFDPQAESWVGARGLMQIMPGTASEMGIDVGQLTDPAVNIRAGARYLKKLQRTFADVHDASERTRFVLAAYNGGALHVRDAMALTHKHGGDPHRWEEVAPYVLKLSEPQFYNDPVVTSGYMRGSETVTYVAQTIERWHAYKIYARPHIRGSTPKPALKHLKNGTHRSSVKSAEHFDADSVS